MQKVTVRVPGSCGELIQGSIRGQDFLISCPINLYTKATAFFADNPRESQLVVKKQGKNLNSEDIEGLNRTEKIENALKMILKHYNFKEKTAVIRINSELPPGIGMASSTADISAAAAALMLLLNDRVDLEFLKKVCLSLEPSDGVFLEGLHLFDHLKGKVDYALGPAPEIEILIFKEKGRIDSMEFNHLEKLSELNQFKEVKLKKALQLIKKGIKEENYQLIGQGTIISSLAHQAILKKNNLDKLVKIITEKKEVYGVNIAHSGTVIGVLIKNNFKSKKIIKEIKDQTGLEYLSRVKMVSGGIERRVKNEAFTWRKIIGSSCSE